MTAILLIKSNELQAQGPITPNVVNVGQEVRLVNSGEIYFRGNNSDPNQGLGWYGITPRDLPKVWDGISSDGPVLYGYDGGALGTNHSGSLQTALRWNRNNQVIIGNVTANGNYGLFVERGILTEHVKVAIKTTTDWSDHVFDRQYSLLRLYKVQQYIAANHHLPGIPAATEVVANGKDLAEMDSRLLQKVEELTLYVSQQQKEIDALKKKLKHRNLTSFSFSIIIFSEHETLHLFTSRYCDSFSGL